MFFFLNSLHSMCSKKIINGTQKLGMVPKFWRHFLDSKNDENWSFDKMRQKVWVPFGYYFGYHSTFWVPLGYHFGYHYDDFSYRKNWFFSKSQHLMAYFGYRMVPQVVPQWYPKFFYLKVWSFSFLKPYRLLLYDI